MRAAVLQGAKLSVEDVKRPEPREGEVLIAPMYTGICGSDLHVRAVFKDLADAMPGHAFDAMVPGHEFVGTVVELGPNSHSDLVIGDLVTAIPFTHSDGPFGHGPAATIGLSPQHGGGLAELTVVDISRTFKLPEGLEPKLGALCEPMSVSQHAYSLGLSAGPIVVVGAGPVGLGIVAFAALAGRDQIVVVDPAKARRDMALRFGASAAIEPGTPLDEILANVGFKPSPTSPLLNSTANRATIFECVGKPDVVRSTLTEAPPHCRVVVAGACTHDVTLNPLQPTLNETSVEFSFAYTSTDFARTLEMLKEHADKFEPLITSVRSLEDVAAAFDDLIEPEELKILIMPN